MPKPAPIFPKLDVPPRPTDLPSNPNALRQYPGFGHSLLGAADSGPHQQIYRTKRKHVLKACDRCRVKKTKCDGNQPCYRCSAYNHPCLFRERKAMQTKTYSKGFVEMLESHHALVVKALQQLYTHCVNNKCFPGEPIEVVEGYPLTHAILDRMGLIKQAEVKSEQTDPESLEVSQFRDERRSSSTSVDSNELSPESPGGREMSPSSTTSSSPENEEFPTVKCQPETTATYDTYSVYPCGGQVGQSATVGVTNTTGVTRYWAERGAAAAPANRPPKSADASEVSTYNVLLNETHTNIAGAGFFPQPENHSGYADFPRNPYQDMQNPFQNTAQHYLWNFSHWTQ